MKKIIVSWSFFGWKTRIATRKKQRESGWMSGSGFGELCLLSDPRWVDRWNAGPRADHWSGVERVRIVMERIVSGKIRVIQLGTGRGKHDSEKNDGELQKKTKTELLFVQCINEHLRWLSLWLVVRGLKFEYSNCRPMAGLYTLQNVVILSNFPKFSRFCIFYFHYLYENLSPCRNRFASKWTFGFIGLYYLWLILMNWIGIFFRSLIKLSFAQKRFGPWKCLRSDEYHALPLPFRPNQDFVILFTLRSKMFIKIYH